MTGNNLSGIASQFATQAGHIATQMKKMCSNFLCFLHNPWILTSFVQKTSKIFKTATQSLSTTVNYTLNESLNNVHV